MMGTARLRHTACLRKRAVARHLVHVNINAGARPDSPNRVKQSLLEGRNMGRRTMATTSGGGSGPACHHSGVGSIQQRQLPGLPTREAQVVRLASGEELDVLVVGGGATGCGAALDAQMRGLSTGLIERGDFGSETSSRSTKLIWAGIRYIATATSSLLRLRNLWRPRAALEEFWGEFKMVLGAHRERRFLLEKQMHLTHWMPIAVPIQSWLAWPPPFGHPMFAAAPLVLPAVMKLYDALGGFTCPPSHIMGRKRAQRKFPQLDASFKYAQVFYEGMHNDARTNTAIALTAAEEGACICNHVEMVELLHGGPDGATATGVRCRDNLTGEEFEVRARSIIFAGGPFTDQLRMLEDTEATPAVAGAAGTHLVLPSYYCPGGMGMLDMNTSDGRFLFFLPWQGAVVVGTTDVKGTPVTSPRPPEQEIEWILNEVKKYLSPELRVRRSDVLSAWYGWRPLASDPNALPGAPISRDHIISTHPQTGTTFITGGKWTTYREMAEDVRQSALLSCGDTVIVNPHRCLVRTHGDVIPRLIVVRWNAEVIQVIDRIVELKQFTHATKCVTLDRVLWGGEEVGTDNPTKYSPNLAIQLVQNYGVSESTAFHLASTYGVKAFAVCEMSEPTGKSFPSHGVPLAEGLPHIECEVKYGCMEYTRTVYDMLSLRTRLAYINIAAAVSAAPRVTKLMAGELGWDEAESARQLADAYERLAEFAGPVPDDSPDSAERRLLVTDLDALFRLFDKDGNGRIILSEMTAAAAALGLPFESDADAAQAFAAMSGGLEECTQERFVMWWTELRYVDVNPSISTLLEPIRYH